MARYLGLDNLGLDNLGLDNLGLDNLGLDNLGLDNLGLDNLGLDNLGLDTFTLLVHLKTNNSKNICVHCFFFKQIKRKRDNFLTTVNCKLYTLQFRW